MPLDLTEFITQSLSPALAISASGMLSLGMHNRLSILGGRVRQLNREIITESGSHRVANLKEQVKLFIQRAVILRNSLFLLYAAICLMVLTAVSLAFKELGVLWSELIPMATFLGGLSLIFSAVVLEAWEVLLILRTLELDVAGIRDAATE